VTGCCSASAQRVFSTKQARRDARRYRRRGLDRTARRMVGELRERGVDGATVLDVGGGIGAIDVELLGAGAASATTVELSDGYEEEAARLLADRGVEGRVARRVGDFVEEAGEIAPADVVVMHRVVCGYPDEEALVGAASDRAGRLLALTFPRDRFLVRTAFGAMNVFMRRLFDFEAYVRPTAAVLAPAEARGMRVVHEHRGAVWALAVLERPS
jgi:magnesium-protoporphyrin O-methyltransferase